MFRFLFNSNFQNASNVYRLRKVPDLRNNIVVGLKDSLPFEGLTAESAKTTEERECMFLNMQATRSHTECD